MLDFYRWLEAQDSKVRAKPLKYPMLYVAWIRFNYWMVKPFSYLWH
jgi:hypothetical protein